MHCSLINCKKYFPKSISLLTVLVMFCHFILTGCSSTDKNLIKLRSDQAMDRVEAILWLYYNKKGDTTKKLLRQALLKDESPLVRSLAIRLMVLEKDKDYLPLIQEALNDPEYLVRMEAAQAVGSFKALSLQQVLGKCLVEDPHIWVRLKILKTIGYMEAEKTVPFLIEALADQEPKVRFQALTLLKKFTGKELGRDKKEWLKWYKSNKDVTS